MDVSLLEMSMDLEDEMMEEYGRRFRRERGFKERPDYFNLLSEFEFVARFRLSKRTVCLLLDEIITAIENPTKRSESVPAMAKLLMTLRFYATGCFLIVCGDFSGLHKSTACSIVAEVTKALSSLRSKYIKMPSTDAEIQSTQRNFYRISAFPNVIGTIDCTHVRIQCPGGENAEVFRNRKGYYSLNVQTGSGPDLKVLDIVARWPGSAHDSTIFSNSEIRNKFEDGDFGNSILLEDSGYALKAYLITPIRNPVTPAELVFNEAQIRTRNTVERQYGVLKRRFSVLAYGLRLKLDTAKRVIVACAVFHNMAVDAKDPLPDSAESREGLEAAIANGNILPNPYTGNSNGLSSSPRDFYIQIFENNI